MKPEVVQSAATDSLAWVMFRSELIDNTELACMQYRESFMKHSFLWMESIDQVPPFRDGILDMSCQVEVHPNPGTLCLMLQFRGVQQVPRGQPKRSGTGPLQCTLYGCMNSRSES